MLSASARPRRDAKLGLSEGTIASALQPALISCTRTRVALLGVPVLELRRRVRSQRISAAGTSGLVVPTVGTGLSAASEGASTSSCDQLGMERRPGT